MHQIVCQLRLRPRPYTGRAYSAPLAVFRGPTSKGEGRWKGGEERKGEGGRGKEKRGVLYHRKKKEKSAPLRLGAVSYSSSMQ